MSDENLFEELAETRRKLWAESDGTLDGYFRMCDRLGWEARERYLAKQAGKPAGRRAPSRRRKQPEFADATMVREGNAPRYGAGETSDLARKGEEGDAV